MKSENKRIFISDLPETFTKEELESKFSKYGNVSSVEIKERKELGPNNTSLFFAYINVITDDGNLNQCFRDLSNTEWHGQYVQLQVARESFLERLKRERLEADTIKEVVSSKPIALKSNGVSINKKKYKSFSEPESDLSDTNIRTATTAEPEISDIIIKNNKNKLNDKTGLRIPSIGKAPIVEISTIKPKPNDSVANTKRLQSLRDRKKDYEAQKLCIKSALSYSANKSNNKIIFDDNSYISKSKLNGLFDNSEDDEEFNPNFTVKEQFQGKVGQKLLELQSKYKNDKRFALDERFIEDDAEISNETDVSAEKKEQLKILEEVLGRKVTATLAVKKEEHSAAKKIMVKFDPLQPKHANLQLTVEPQKKKRKKEQEPEAPEEPQPAVSKEIFYKVPEKLKETFEEKSQFSLLNLYGKTEEDKTHLNEEAKEIKPNHLKSNQNPFKYDSSDGEDEIGDIPHKETNSKTFSQPQQTDPKSTRANQSVFWVEPFFFKSDDFRLQEGLDFIEKIKGENKEFQKIRRELKGIVKAKVRNNERKNKMFKKKLGGSKRKKHIRMKKALKR